MRAEQAGWCSISAVAVFKRLRASERWLQWIAQRLWRSFPTPLSPARRVRAGDATTVQEYGNTGTDWRVHFAIDSHGLHCDHFELTDVRGGETFRRIPVPPGDVLLGDRICGTPPGIASVAGRGGHIVVRVSPISLPLRDKHGRRIAVQQQLRRLRVGQVGDGFARVDGPDRAVKGRLVAIKLGRVAAQVARRRQQRKATKKQQAVSKRSRF